MTDDEQAIRQAQREAEQAARERQTTEHPAVPAAEPSRGLPDHDRVGKPRDPGNPA